MNGPLEQPGYRKDTAAPLVTIGIPVYNGADHLAEALESVLAQDYPNLEVVVCDNASEDDTPTIVARFASKDPRVRSVRNPTNIGLLPNFRRVRDEAHGKYFGWLGHDDLLSDPGYISAVVAFLEDHPKVVLCHTWISMLRPSGETQVIEFPELDPGRPWAEAQRDLFRWPQDWLEMASHGIFRREALVQVPMPERTRTGRPYLFCWEINLLTTLATRGRVVALPQALRTYRSSPDSAARQMGRSVSPFDLFLLELETKLTLLARAMLAPGTPKDRTRLTAAAAANLPGNTFRRRFDHRTALKLLDQELALLLRAAHERSKLAEYLQSEIEARRRILLDRGEDPGPFSPWSPEALPTAEGAIVRPTRGPLSDFFHPASEAQIRWYRELNDRVSRLRGYCERQMVQINRAQAEADALLARI